MIKKLNIRRKILALNYKVGNTINIQRIIIQIIKKMIKIVKFYQIYLNFVI